jgi:hypothetical protein
MNFKQSALALVCILLSIGAVAQKKSVNNRYANDSKYSKFVQKNKLPFKAQNAVSLTLDEMFTLKRIGIGFQRTAGSFMAHAQVSTGYADGGKFSGRKLQNETNTIATGGINANGASIKEKLGLTLGLYWRSAAAIATTGPYMGVLLRYNTNDVTYNYTNTYSRMGVYYLVGSRLLIVGPVGLDAGVGLGYQKVTLGKSDASDPFNEFTTGGLDYTLSSRIFYTF